MIFLSVNADTGEIYGRVREELPEGTVQVSEELFGRYLGDPSAFIYYPDRNTIDIRPDYEAPIVQSISPAVLEIYQTRAQEEIYIPELDVHVSIAGIYGRVLLAALALAQYVPQTILVYDKGAYSKVEINATNLEYFAEAYSKHFAEIAGETNEQVE